MGPLLVRWSATSVVAATVTAAGVVHLRAELLDIISGFVLQGLERRRVLGVAVVPAGLVVGPRGTQPIGVVAVVRTWVGDGADAVDGSPAPPPGPEPTPTVLRAVVEDAVGDVTVSAERPPSTPTCSARS